MAEEVLRSSHSREMAIRANRQVYWLAYHWLLVFSLVYGFYVGLPFLAPVLMKLGMESPASVIYTIYSFLCHQLPQRSFFLFGQQFTYPTAEILSVWGNTSNPLIFRQFIGNAALGWKVAWSDRMVSLYTSILFFAWIWYPLRRRIPRLRWQGLLMLTIPIVVDGLSHLYTDLFGMGQNFREANLWLVTLTNHAFPPSFYVGDAWGSFNSLMRLITGILFGAGIVWFGFPYVEEFFTDLKDRIRYKFHRAGIPL